MWINFLRFFYIFSFVYWSLRVLSRERFNRTSNGTLFCFCMHVYICAWAGSRWKYRGRWKFRTWNRATTHNVTRTRVISGVLKMNNLINKIWMNTIVYRIHLQNRKRYIWSNRTYCIGRCFDHLHRPESHECVCVCGKIYKRHNDEHTYVRRKCFFVTSCDEYIEANGFGDTKLNKCTE